MSKDKLLLVEDNPSDVALAQEAFAECGVTEEIVLAKDGAEALDYLLGPASAKGEEAAGLPRLVLLDLRLPKIDGLEVLQRVRSDGRTKRVPIVVLTTSTEEGDVARAYDLGCNGFVQKTMSLDRFIESIRVIKSFFLELNVRPPQPR